MIITNVNQDGKCLNGKFNCVDGNYVRSIIEQLTISRKLANLFKF